MVETFSAEAEGETADAQPPFYLRLDSARLMSWQSPEPPKPLIKEYTLNHIKRDLIIF